MADRQSKSFLISESHYRSRGWLKSLNNQFHISLISIMPSERKFYKKNDIQINKLYKLDEFVKKKIRVNKLNIINQFEKKNKINISEFVNTDRKLKFYSDIEIIDYTAKLIIYFRKIINENKFLFCCMEITWFHEIILFYICKEKDLNVFYPDRCKFSFNKFYIFKDFSRSILLERKNKKKLVYKDLYKELSNHLPKNKQKNKYNEKEFVRLSERNNFGFDKFRLLIILIFRKINGGFYPYIHNNLSWYLFNKIECIIRKKLLTYFYKFDEVNLLKTKYVYIPLHVQPESGIDLVGRRYSNQLEFIKKCSLSLPSEYKIVIKDHPHDFGRKKAIFYKKLQALYNCKVVSTNTSVHEIISNSSLVITIVGTASLESILMKVPSLSAVKMYYSKLCVQEKFDPENDSLAVILNKIKIWKKYRNSSQFKKDLCDIYSSRYEGNVGGIDINKDILNEDNMKKVNQVFEELCNVKN